MLSKPAPGFRSMEDLLTQSLRALSKMTETKNPFILDRIAKAHGAVTYARSILRDASDLDWDYVPIEEAKP